MLFFRRTLCVAVIVAATPLAALTPTPGRQVETIEVAGEKRRFIVNIPPDYDGTKKRPLVFMLHGATGTAEQAERGYGFVDLAAQKNFIVVFPQAVGEPAAWNSGYNSGVRNNTDDVAFFKAMVKELKEELKIDGNRIFVTGHSSGAMMTHRLAAEMPETFAAAAAVEGSAGGVIDGKTVTVAKPSQPIPMLMIHGKDDRIVPYDGGGLGRLVFLSVDDSVNFWCDANGIASSPETTTLANGTRSVWKGTNPGSEVQLIALGEGNHAWPGGRVNLGNDGFDATGEIWKFFKDHPRRPSQKVAAAVSDPQPEKKRTDADMPEAGPAMNQPMDMMAMDGDGEEGGPTGYRPGLTGKAPVSVVDAQAAWETAPAPTATEQRRGAAVDAFAELGLSPEQREKVAAIVKKGGGKIGTPETRGKIAKILTPEQRTKFRQIMRERQGEDDAMESGKRPRKSR